MQPKPRLLDEVRAVCRMRHLSLRTERAVNFPFSILDFSFVILKRTDKSIIIQMTNLK